MTSTQNSQSFRRSARRAIGVGAAAATAIVAAVLAGPAAASAATGNSGGSGSTAPSAPAPAFDFSTCPALPAGLDTHTWRCEAHILTGSATVGSVTTPLGPFTITHAEGPLADGTLGQVFGTLRSAVTAVPGGLTGTSAGDHSPLLRLGVEPRYAGYADLIGNGPDPGGFYLALRLHNPLLGRACSIGSVAHPIKTHLARVGTTVVTPTNPPVRTFTLQDTAFAVPAASGCGPSDRLVDARFGLPSPASHNSLTLRTSYTYKTYDQLGH